MGYAVAFQMLSPCERFPTAFHRAHEPPVILVLPFVPQEFGHAGEVPATAVKVTKERSLTCVAPQVNFQATSLVVLFATAWKRAGKCSCSLKWARLWENRALTVINVFLQPEMRTGMASQVRNGCAGGR